MLQSFGHASAFACTDKVHGMLWTNSSVDFLYVWFATQNVLVGFVVGWKLLEHMQLDKFRRSKRLKVVSLHAQVIFLCEQTIFSQWYMEIWHFFLNAIYLQCTWHLVHKNFSPGLWNHFFVCSSGFSDAVFLMTALNRCGPLGTCGPIVGCHCMHTMTPTAWWYTNMDMLKGLNHGDFL